MEKGIVVKNNTIKSIGPPINTHREKNIPAIINIREA